MLGIFLKPFVWSAAIFFSWAGYGALLALLLYPKKASLGLKAALGLALGVIVGGLVNLTSTFSKTFVFAYLALGLGLFLFFVLKDRAGIFRQLKDFFNEVKKNKLAGLLFAGLCALMLFQFVLSISLPPNQADDYGGYFVFTAKMMQTGSIGKDPFSERRIESALGGQNFLDGLVFAELPWQDSNVLDRVLGWVILALLVWGIASKANLSLGLKAILGFSIFLLSPPIINSTSVLTGSVLFFCLLTITDTGEKFWPENFREILLLALIIAALCGLKSSFIPPTFMFLLVIYWVRWKDGWRFSLALKSFVLVGLTSFILLLPWMLVMHQSSGTLLYPLLGRGFHGSVYGSLLSPYAHLSLTNLLNLLYQLANTMIVVFLAIGFLLFNLYFNRRQFNKKLGGVFIGAVLSMGVLAFLTGGYGTYRFSFAFLLPVVVWIIVELLTPKADDVSQTFGFSARHWALFFLMLILGMGLTGFFNEFKADLANINSRVSENRQSGLKDYLSDIKLSAVEITEQDKKTYSLLQNSLPEHATILTQLEKPFLLDFKRNNIYIADAPGGASPPPGMPVSKGPQALADYLLSQNIHYVAYSHYADWEKQNSRALMPTMNAWLRSLAQDNLNFQNNLEALEKNHKLLYDDGKNRVMDLAALK